MARDPLKVKAYRRRFYERNKQRLLEQMKKYREVHKEYFDNYNRQYYLKNKEQMNRDGKIWRAANLHKEKAANAKWRAEHKEQKKNTAAKYAKSNPAKVNASAMRHHTSKLKAIPKWANHTAIECYYEFAALKSKIMGEPWEVDHIVPLQSKNVCGLHTDWNMQVIHKTANLTKGNRVWPDMP